MCYCCTNVFINKYGTVMVLLYSLPRAVFLFVFFVQYF